MEHEEDTILAILCAHHYDSSNTNDIPLTLKGLSIATQSSQQRVADLLDVLVREKLVERVGRRTYRISGLEVGRGRRLY